MTAGHFDNDSVVKFPNQRTYLKNGGCDFNDCLLITPDTSNESGYNKAKSLIEVIRLWNTIGSYD
ncbi:hypothetical protein KB1253_11150 [Lactiplantibacillus plantarum]|nr:hypothetical protein KB1253_11150 [Lactiplantibacillus plantarum]